jgi:hypothetical protein
MTTTTITRRQYSAALKQYGRAHNDIQRTLKALQKAGVPAFTAEQLRIVRTLAKLAASAAWRASKDDKRALAETDVLEVGATAVDYAIFDLTKGRHGVDELWSEVEAMAVGVSPAIAESPANPYQGSERLAALVALDGHANTLHMAALTADTAERQAA